MLTDEQITDAQIKIIRDREVWLKMRQTAKQYGDDLLFRVCEDRLFESNDQMRELEKMRKGVK